MADLEPFLRAEVCGQTLLPDMSILIRQKLIENEKNQTQ